MGQKTNARAGTNTSIAGTGIVTLTGLVFAVAPEVASVDAEYFL